MTKLEKRMRFLAKKTGLEYTAEDGPLDYDHDMIHVFANDMSEAQYDSMEKQMEQFEIKRKHYRVGVWNDVSGYKYWEKEGENDDSNYIQISVYVKNADKADPVQMKEDAEKAYDEFCCWGNTDQHDFKKRA